MNNRTRVYQALKKTGLPVAQTRYGDYISGADTTTPNNPLPNLPFITFHHSGETILFADGKRYAVLEKFIVSLWLDKRRDEVEEKVEEAITKNFGTFERDFDYDDNGRAYVIDYEFTIHPDEGTK
ncbi:hypothetical protein [Atopobium fossor]|uniref:hypothetical protein n=1 Tax=Atopobium fossor TaxID=39487 RepID=UPI000487E79A|nr:hypothetical protein [Atopobium fossor]